MLFIGPHISIAGSIALAPMRAFELGATGFAMFTKNQRHWKSTPLEADEIALFKENMTKLGYSEAAVLPHAGYLINPASPDKALWDKSLSLLSDEVDRLERLGIHRINIHPGAFKEGEREEGIKRSANMLDIVLSKHTSFHIAVENTAGAGTILGSTFEELAEILDSIENKDRLGFTLDTAHLFGAGYDVRNEIAPILDRFFSLFGSEKLYGMHLNDSKAPLSSKKDRHESLGLGLIGKEAFLEIARRKELDNKPLILETPNEALWSAEIKELLDENKR